MSSRYSTEFKEKLIRAYFLQKVKFTFNKFEEEKQRAEEFYQKHYCENSPSGHQFHKFQPHPGCVKTLCKFCAQENPDKLFQPSLNAFKARTFHFKKKDFKRPPREYQCG